MKKICCAVLLLCTLVGAAQNVQPPAPKYKPHQFVISFNPLALLNTDRRLMFGAEYRIGSRMSVVGDAGVIVGSGYMKGQGTANGLELRPALRHYIGRNRLGYVQGQLHYRAVQYQLYDWLGQNCINGVPTYEKMQEFTFQKKQAGAALVAGGTGRLGRRWLLDASAGFGLVYRTQKVKGEENCCYLPPDNFFGNQAQNNAWIPVVPVALKLGYVIN